MGILGSFAVSGSSADEAVEYRNAGWPLNVTLEVVRAQAASPPIGGAFDLTQDDVTIEGQYCLVYVSVCLSIHLSVCLDACFFTAVLLVLLLKPIPASSYKKSFNIF